MAADRFVAWLRREIDFLGSRRLALVILPIVVALLALYILIPQHGRTEAALVQRWIEQKGVVGQLFDLLQLTDLRHSGLFYSAYAVLFVNLLVCMIQRIPTAILLCRFPDKLPASASQWPAQEVEVRGLETERVAALLTEKGYRTQVWGDSIYALRGRFAVVGHWLFHVCCLVLMAGGFFLLVGPSPFRGSVGIGEGEFFELQTAPFLGSNRPPSPDLPALRFQIKKIDVLTEGTDLRRFETTVTTPEGERATLGINRPYRKPPYQVMANGFGYMPGWAIVNSRGRMLYGAWVKLVPFPLAPEDDFSLGTDEGSVHVRFYPDYEQGGEEDRSRGYQLRNPKFKARIEFHGEPIFEGLLEPGERVPIDERRDFFFLPEIRMYTMLDVIQEKGHLTVFACLGGMILGLVIRYARIRKEILVKILDRKLRIAGRSEILQGLFSEELEQLASEIVSLNRSPGDRKGAL